MITIDEFKNKISKKSRLLGLDLGSKRIGVAICDDKQSIATPFTTITKENNAKFINELKLIVKENTKFMAEREGFEPSIVLPLYTLSKRAD